MGLLFVCIHSIILYLGIFGDNSDGVGFLGITVVFIRLLLKRVYIDQSFFVISAKKYYYKDIQKVIEDQAVKLKLIIADKEHIVDCESRRVKEILLEKLKKEGIPLD